MRVVMTNHPLGADMFSVEKSENMKTFEKCIMAIKGKEIVPMSIAVYHCWKLFQLQHNDVSSWKKSPSEQRAWLNELAALEAAFSNKEAHHELPYGTAYGIHMSILFYQALAMNESPKTIIAMADFIEQLNEIGYQLSNNTNTHDAVIHDSTADLGMHQVSHNHPHLSNPHVAGAAHANHISTQL